MGIRGDDEALVPAFPSLGLKGLNNSLSKAFSTFRRLNVLIETPVPEFERLANQNGSRDLIDRQGQSNSIGLSTFRQK